MVDFTKGTDIEARDDLIQELTVNKKKPSIATKNDYKNLANSLKNGIEANSSVINSWFTEPFKTSLSFDEKIDVLILVLNRIKKSR